MESSPAISPAGTQLTFKILDAPVPGMKANLKISGITGPNPDGSYPMTVNPDGSATATISDVPAGNQTLTVTFYDSPGVTIIAQASTSGSVTAGSTTNVSISQSQINTNFDNDNDGSTNLVELNSGSNPNDPGSRPTATTVTLTVTKSGTGSGTVTSSPIGISCGLDCSEAYTSGTSVTLTATPAAGSVFAGWSGGGCTGTGTCIVTMNAAPAVTATFNTTTTPTFALTITKSGTGTVTSSPAGINCGLDCSETYNSGTSVTLTATPDAGSTFAGWSGGDCTGTGTCNVTMSADTTVTATFNPAPPGTVTLTVTKSGTGTGTVTSSPAGINCGATCSASYNNGTSVILTATPDAGSVFSGWSGGGCTGTGTCTGTMSADTTVTAFFIPAETTPPDTTIISGPTDPTNSTTATFSFTGSDNVTPATSLTFQCRLDAGAFEACTSPKTYTALVAGPHTFSVKATDAAGNTDATPAIQAWTIDTTAPTFSGLVTAAATGPSSIDLAWTAATDNLTPASSISYQICQSQTTGGCATTFAAAKAVTGTTLATITGLASKTTYFFVVRAQDQAGNSDSNTIEKSATTLTQAPTAMITAAPTSGSPPLTVNFGSTGSTDPDGTITTFEWDFDYDGTTFTVDATGATASHIYTGTTTGKHTAALRVTDNDGASSIATTSISAQTIIDASNATISTNTTWSLAQSPFVITASITVVNGATLTIDPGVTLRFQSGKGVLIGNTTGGTTGTLVAKGTAALPITFTSNAAIPAQGDWNFIKFQDTSIDAAYDLAGNYVSGSILQFCTIEYSGGPTTAPNPALRLESSAPFIDNCKVQKNKNIGISISGAIIPERKITNSNISNNQSTGMSIPADGTYTLTGNTVSNNTGKGISISYGPGGALTLTLTGNTVSNNTGTGISMSSDFFSGGAVTPPHTHTLTGNTVSNNQGGGIMGISCCATISISKNLIQGNSSIQDGSAISVGNCPSPCQVTQNTIVDNKSTKTTDPNAIFINSSNLVLNNNNILRNQGVDIFNALSQTSPNIDAKNNWWGTTDLVAISLEIWDFSDDSTKGIIDFQPFLTSACTPTVGGCPDIPAAPAKANIFTDQAGPQVGTQEGGSQLASDQDESHSAFGCGGIDIKGGGPSGPSDMGGLGSLLAILSLPFILRRWRLKRLKESSV